MRMTLRLATLAAMILAASRVSAQVATPDPDVRGPVRRAAGAAAEAVGAPGVEDRIENREQRRDVRDADNNPHAAARAETRIADADRWRYKYHNNQWWYYTPQNRWMIYNNNRWGNYDPQTYVRPDARYSTGYRGPVTNDGYYVRRGVLGRRSYYYRPNAATNTGANIGADVGAAVNGAAGAQRGAAAGAAIGETIDAAHNAVRPALPPPAPQ